jgi:hypothetical protein
MNEKFKWRTAGRLRRGAVLLGVVGLTAGAAMLTAGSALAANGSQPGNLVLNPASGASTLTPAASTTTGCPAGFQGSAQLEEFNTDGTAASRISQVNNAVTAPFSLNLIGNVGALLGSTNLPATGGTVEWAVGCYSLSAGTGSVQYVQSTFVTLSADGSSFTSSATGPVLTATTTTLVAAPSPAAVGGTVTLTATVTAADSTHPAGNVQFEVGGTNIGSAVAVNASGVATMTTSFAAAGTEALSAVFTPTPTTYAGSTGTFSLVVQVAGTQTAGSEPITVTVPQTGTLTVTVAPGTVSLTTANPPTSATGTLQNVTVTDTRNFVPGWSVSGQESDFTGSGTAAGATISGNQLGWAPTSVGALQGGAILGGTVAPAAPGLGSTAAVLAQAHAGNGLGVNTLSANLTLAIPATQLAGPYAGSLTITYVVSNP